MAVGRAEGLAQIILIYRIYIIFDDKSTQVLEDKPKPRTQNRMNENNWKTGNTSCTRTTYYYIIIWTELNKTVSI